MEQFTSTFQCPPAPQRRCDGSRPCIRCVKMRIPCEELPDLRRRQFQSTDVKRQARDIRRMRGDNNLSKSAQEKSIMRGSVQTGEHLSNLNDGLQHKHPKHSAELDWGHPRPGETDLDARPHDQLGTPVYFQPRSGMLHPASSTPILQTQF